jgi:hypothetical protein
VSRVTRKEFPQKSRLPRHAGLQRRFVQRLLRRGHVVRQFQRQPVRTDAKGMGQKHPRIPCRIFHLRVLQQGNGTAQRIRGFHPSISASRSA